MADLARLRLAFFGSAELAVASLRALAAEAAFQIVAVVSQPDKPQGRELRPQPTPVTRAASELHLPVHTPARCRDVGFLEQVRTWDLDLGVVAAYGQILPPALLALPRHGFINVHTSLLPRYRGAAPIQWALINGDTTTGVTLMKVDAGLDTGDMLLQTATAITPEDDAQTLHDRLAHLGAELLVRTIPRFVAGELVPQPQPAEGVCYARKITKEDGRLNWLLPARVLWNRVRGLVPWPGTFTFVPGVPKPVLLKVWRAEPVAGEPPEGEPGEIVQADKRGVVVRCGEGALRLLELQREGGRRLAVSDFLAGHPLPRGLRLG
jgi:methionyl-tRNA formyltransferase